MKDIGITGKGKQHQQQLTRNGEASTAILKKGVLAPIGHAASSISY
jgi:hypothetical protein